MALFITDGDDDEVRASLEETANAYEPYPEGTPGIDDYDSKLNPQRLAATYARLMLDEMDKAAKMNKAAKMDEADKMDKADKNDTTK